MNEHTCDQFREVLLDCGAAAEERSKLRHALQHERECVHCQQALRELDILRGNEDEAAPDGGWEAFETRMAHAVIPKQRRNGIRRVRWAMAAGVLLAVGVGLFAVLRPGSSSEQFTWRDAEAPIRAYGEVSKLFDGRAGWISLTSGDGEIGLADAAVHGVDRPLVARLAVISDGKTLSTTDIVIAPGQCARIKLAMPEGRTIAYVLGTDASAPQRLSLWAELSDKNDSIASFATTIDITGTRLVPAGSMTSVRGTYQVKVGLVRSVKSGSEV